MENVTLTVKGMTCHHCVRAIEGSVGKLSGVSKVKVDLREANVEVTYQSEKVKIEQIKETIEDQGYMVCQ
ncbi:copper chaperone CopZ [Neobacillus sp. Marseille-QA0830]